MRIVNHFVCLAAAALMTAWTAGVHAQDCGNCGGAADCTSCGGSDASVAGTCPPCGNCSSRPGCSCPTACNGVGPEGYCIGCGGAVLRPSDHYSPDPLYTYSKNGLQATRTHHWNWRQAGATPWHGHYNYWAYGQPTALVVPPTAAFHTEYNWGVAQTKSWAINHQFNRNDPMGGGVVAGSGMFSNTPYWPSSTNKFGIYPVRGPW